MTDFLLELRCEEIPARMQLKASEDLARLFTEELARAGLKPAAIDSFVTPRRLALVARGLPLETAAVSEEHKGPRTSAPPQALEGFLRKTGLTQDQLEDRDGVWFAVVNKPGRATMDVLAQTVPAVIRAFPWPKAMRWGVASQTTESLRWVRPLQGIVAILGEQLVDIVVEDVRSGYATLGHRFHHPGAITIGGADDYVEKLRACHVIVSHQERQAIIAAKAAQAAAAHGYTVIEDKGLVAENAGLTEWPVPLLGDFDPAFLEVPPEVIQLTLRINQKYFVLRDAAGKLAPAFICTANIEAKDGGAAIVAGNRKVLAARLSDARFFWEQDRKTALADHAQKLARITFHEKLGTVADKVERVAKLARWLVEEGIVKGADADLAEQAARLAKADLVTEMVGEFPELQGVMGGYYARAEGLPDAVADAIRDHYKPVGQGDDVPTAPVTVAVSLADKLDTLVGFFSWGLLPTGSKDPFALRRAALGVIQLILENRVRTSLNGVSYGHAMTVMRQLTSESLTHWQGVLLNYDELPIEKKIQLNEKLSGENPETWAGFEIPPNIAHAMVTFFADRLKVQQREAGVRHDLIDAVFALGGEDDLVRLLARVHALQSFVATDDGANLLAGYKRAANILKKEAVDPAIVPAAPSEPAEAALLAALDAAEPLAARAVTDERFADAMAALATLRAPIDAFFESVTVNDADPAKRAARLALLDRVRAAVHGVADFSKITG
ncbi:glycine--tRNA ligase subunit beta [Sphingobium cupriresistens]|uniref:Glycine--tRNA ligase beta subunit n=1 Tax=Sphingobium cupriresistens TaxID=1132417 RepID=A0A8G2DZU4_9SPHN|nr:glycine--tRNA ligase subunit beta [Sphingobium cupriresistens]RYM11295.1 glycine--tRNA ligase subunit beta [Sphingobium cupriresistens]